MTDRRALMLLVVAAALIAVGSASDHACSWNDASRLATIECLIDHRTWAIDDSVFVQPPNAGKTPHPYGNQATQFPNGTLDKLRIGNRYYSDKTPTPALMLAGLYQLFRWLGGPNAAERPDIYCTLITVFSSGLAYVIAVSCTFQLARHNGLAIATSVLIASAIGSGTLAVPYVQTVNNHEMLLGVAAALILALDCRRILWSGFLAGLAYTIDAGVGPIILLGTLCYSAAQSYALRKMCRFAAFAAPWILLHHALNYHIGGTIRPANANPDYLNWPGSPFASGAISGSWNHASPMAFGVYALDLLVGKRGFWGHNLPLLAILPAFLTPIRRRPEFFLCMAWCIGTWLIYAAGSTNYSGACLSIRWFVPLIAPIAWISILHLKEHGTASGLAALTVVGAGEMCIAWQRGPWSERVLPGYWAFVICGVALLWTANRSRLGDKSSEHVTRAAA